MSDTVGSTLTGRGHPTIGAGQATGRPRLGALDGLRALAVTAVIAYHLGAGWLAGGYLGVDLFFVLSGFLITGLLLGEHRTKGAIALGAFWARRARRLLPGLLMLLLVLAAAAAAGLLVGVAGPAALRGDVLSTLAYVANWHQLVAGQSYFARFATPSPLAHAWSLAIEEQFYLLWPPALVLMAWLAARHARRAGAAPRLIACAAGVGALASATWMGWLAAHAASADRLYYGTDTRAFELLAGAALAAAVCGRPEPGPATRRVLHVTSVGGLGVIGALMVVAGGQNAAPARWVFEGGMALCTLAAVAVLADIRLTQPGPLGRVLAAAPLRFVGRISYALYLWHWPVICELTSARTGLQGVALDGLRLVVMATLAVSSTLLLEEPLRKVAGAAAGARTRADRRSLAWRRARTAVLVPASVLGAAGVVTLTMLPFQSAAAAVGPALAAGPVPGGGGLADEAALDRARIPVPTARAPLRVTLLGDSVMWVQAPAVTAALEATGAVAVTDMSFPGWGLSTDPSWPATVPAMLERTRPQLVVATWSWDDNWLLNDPAGYRASLERFLALLLHPTGGAPAVGAVVLEQFPPLGPLPQASGGAAGQARRVDGVRAWNALAASMPARFPGRVLYLPLAPAVEHDGAYATWLRAGGGWVRVRSVDATHFCPAGAARYAAALLWDLSSEVQLPPAVPGWWSGSWVRSVAYDSPPGACPADSPPAHA
jgi:peptidoglycan/LPS O-acetylase OafA/YrhL